MRRMWPWLAAILLFLTLGVFADVIRKQNEELRRRREIIQECVRGWDFCIDVLKDCNGLLKKRLSPAPFVIPEPGRRST